MYQERLNPALSGLVFCRIEANNDCLFNAVALALGLPNSVSLKRDVVDRMKREAAKLFKKFIPTTSPESFEKYIDAIGNATECGGYIEIEVMQIITGRPIIIIQPDYNPIKYGDYKLSTYDAEPIFIYYNGYNHYDAFTLEPEAESREILRKIQDALREKKTVTYKPKDIGNTLPSGDENKNLVIIHYWKRSSKGPGHLSMQTDLFYLSLWPAEGGEAGSYVFNSYEEDVSLLDHPADDSFCLYSLDTAKLFLELKEIVEKPDFGYTPLSNENSVLHNCSSIIKALLIQGYGKVFFGGDDAAWGLSKMKERMQSFKKKMGIAPGVMVGGILGGMTGAIVGAFVYPFAAVANAPQGIKCGVCKGLASLPTFFGGQKGEWFDKKAEESYKNFEEGVFDIIGPVIKKVSLAVGGLVAIQIFDSQSGQQDIEEALKEGYVTPPVEVVILAMAAQEIEHKVHPNLLYSHNKYDPDYHKGLPHQVYKVMLLDDPEPEKDKSLIM